MATTIVVMVATSILELHDGYIAAIDENRRRAIELVDEDAFHDLRVAAKRERALLHYAAAIDETLDPTRWFRILKPLFRSAGAVRDVHIQQEIARRLAPRGAREYHRQLRRRLDEALWDFSRTTPPNANDWSLLRQHIERGLQSVDAADATSRVESHLRQLESRVEELQRQREDLHNLRIATKNLLYTMHFIGRSFPEHGIPSEAKDPETATSALQKLQRMLGNWHDLEVSLQSEDALGPALDKAIRDEKERLRRRIRYAIGRNV